MKRILLLFTLVALTGIIISPELSAGYIKEKFNFSVVFTSAYPFVYEDNQGYTVIIGEVQNTSDIYSVKDVQITANFYDDDGSEPLEIVKGGTILDVLPPLGKSYYMIKSNSPNPQITQASVSMNGFNGANPKSNQLFVELNDIVVDRSLRFSGVMKNNGASANNINVHLAFYDNSIPHKIIDITTIPIGNVESDEIKKFSFNEGFPTNSVGFFLFSESNVSYSDPVNFTLEPFLNANFESSSEYHINYELYGRQFSDNPLVCADPPDWAVSKNDKQKVNGLTENARIAVQNWQSALQENEKKELKDNWRIDFKILWEKNLQKDCDVIIQFEDKPSERDQWFETLGVTEAFDDGRITVIEIYYNSIQTCIGLLDDYHFYEKPCYNDQIFRTSKQLQETITHEVGHALGLGHYEADDPKINEAWKKGTREPESVMTIFSYDNQKSQNIKSIDVAKVKSMYGITGFKSNSVSPPISELALDPKPKPIPPTIPNWIKQNAKWWADGVITDKDFVAGIQYLVQQKIIKIGSTVQPSTVTHDIPSWVKNNAKWWSEDKISEDEFLRGIQFLASNEIIKLNSNDVIIKLNSNDEKNWFNKGDALFDSGKYTEAINAYDQVIKINPKNAEAWFNKGLALDNLKKWEEAINAYDQAIKLNPKDAEAWFNKGSVLYILAKDEEANKALDQAIKLNPKNPDIWYMKGNVLDELDLSEEAINAYDMAIMIDPKHKGAWKSKCMHFEEFKKYTKQCTESFK